MSCLVCVCLCWVVIDCCFLFGFVRFVFVSVCAVSVAFVSVRLCCCGVLSLRVVASD